MIYSINMHTTVYQFWRFVYHHKQSEIDHYARSSLYTRSFCTGIKLYIGHFLWPRCKMFFQTVKRERSFYQNMKLSLVNLEFKRNNARNIYKGGRYKYLNIIYLIYYYNCKDIVIQFHPKDQQLMVDHAASSAWRTYLRSEGRGRLLNCFPPLQIDSTQSVIDKKKTLKILTKAVWNLKCYSKISCYT